MRRICVSLVALFGLLAAQEAVAGGRAALVIGNGAYVHAAHLQNPAHDAQAMAAALTRLGYSVHVVTDAGKPAMEAALNRFAATAAGADQAVIYYSGHGMEVDGGINYLLPVDAQVTSATTVSLQGIRLPGVGFRLARTP